MDLILEAQNVLFVLDRVIEGESLAAASSVCTVVPETETYKVQEYHLPVYHHLCAEVEAYFFSE